MIINADMTVIGVYQREKVLKDLCYEEIECVILDVYKDQEKALNIPLNKISGEWDMGKLKDIIGGLDAGDFDVGLTGFYYGEIESLLNELDPKSVKEDNCDEPPPENPITRQGDIWLLGRHCLICGDSRKPETYAALMDGKKANSIVKDPPYNVSYEGTAGKTKNDNMDDKKFYEFLVAAFKSMYDHMADGGSIYVFHADKESINFRTAFRDAVLYCHQTCIWVKNS